MTYIQVHFEESTEVKVGEPVRAQYTSQKKE